MGRNCYGPKLIWAEFVMGRNDPEPLYVFLSTACIHFELLELVHVDLF